MFYNQETDNFLILDLLQKIEKAEHYLTEMIHYLQDVNEIQFQCVAEMEADAWPLQKQYLENVHDFHWEYNGLWHLMISQCPTGEYRD